MADTYTWSVNTLDRELSDGVVYTVHWNLNATRPNPASDEEDYTVGSYGSQGLTADPTDPSFVPYDQLTEAICVGWVKAALGDEAVANSEAALSEQLDDLINPVNESGVPW